MRLETQTCHMKYGIEYDKKYGITGEESELRDAAVVEILKDGKEINILK